MSQESSTWLQTQDFLEWKDKFDRDGYLVVKDILSPEEIKAYQRIFEELSTGSQTTTHRHDLGSHTTRKVKEHENISQTMWPSLFIPNLTQGILHTRALEVARSVLGSDMTFDFDMLISKAPHTDTETPMHQDESYWPDMPDKRAVTIWVALDNATVDNGCMWFVPGSHKLPLRPFKCAKEGHHVIICEGDKDELHAAPITAGSCTLHHGRTVHYTRGNSTDFKRRAFIMNFRPAEMVQWERNHDFDHGKSKGVQGDEHFAKETS
nr:phytanoyl-CoA dioxygenase domain-containing protein 1-like [Ciona intestinalis]|eukprot:XP_002122239.1 phytanoyl-CoA dioxygenase domain-containing protein 1-like [Ciona intestinalis]